MLNLELIRETMMGLGLNQAGLAEHCQVSRESVSKWLLGETMPRPNKLKMLALALGQPMSALYRSAVSIPRPVIAYRTQKNQTVSAEACAVALDVAKHLRQLVPLIREASLFSPPILEAPLCDDSYIEKATQLCRGRLKLGARDPLNRSQLLSLHHVFGSILVPVLWSGQLCGHENALSVLLPETKTSFVIFSLNAKNDDFNYWLAHELGHCYTLHHLQGDDGEQFAERFAQELLFPVAAAKDALEKIRNSDQPLKQAHLIADAFGISVVTVIRQADKAARLLGIESTSLETESFWAEWEGMRHLVPTVAYSLFGSSNLSVADYVDRAESYFDTSIFHALARWQHQEGGRSPAFIAAALNVDLVHAFELSHVLSKRWSKKEVTC